MSGTITSPFPSANELLAPQYLAINQQQQANRNQLMPYQLQEAQQQVAGNEMDVMGRVALGIRNLPAEQRPAAYQAQRSYLQSLGYAKDAPSEYPGDAAMDTFISRAVPVAQQYQYGMVSDPAALARLQQLYNGGQTPGAGGGGPDPITGMPVEQALPAIEARESGGRNIATQLKNPDGTPASTASGYYQLLDSTFQDGLKLAGIPGTWKRAMDAPREVQTAVANAIYRRDGATPWAASNPNRRGTQTASTAPSAAPPAAAPTTPAIQQGGAPPAPPGGSGGNYTGGGLASALNPPVQQGGTPPAPPGGSGAAYTGGGIGTALNPPGPIGNQGLVRNPDGTVGTPNAGGLARPQPAPAVRADADAMAAGMRLAQATPRPGVLAAGPAAPTTTTPPAAATPQPGWGTGGATSYSDSPTVAQNQLAPKPPAAPAAQQPPQQQAQPPIGSRANLPRSADVPSGMQAPQVQQAQDMLRRAAQIEATAALQPLNKQLQATAAAMAGDLKARAAVLMQSDSVVQTQEGQLHTLTGKIDDPTKPLADYHETSPGSGIWVGGPGTEPRFQPPGRLVVTPGGDVYQTTTGGAVLLKHTDPAAVAALEEAKAAGAATGTATAKQLPEIMATARNAAAQEGQIDYASRQLQEALKGGIPSGYFSQGLATAAAAAKSLGIDTSRLGVNPEAVGNIQTAQKTLSVIGGAILRQALGPGSAITDGKIEAFIHTQPGIETDPQALQRIMAWARSQYTYERELGQAAVAEAAKPENAGRLPPHWLPGYYRDHGFAPIFDPGTGEMRQPDGQAPSRETPGASPPVGAVIRGFRFKGGDPSKQENWEPQ